MGESGSVKELLVQGHAKVVGNGTEVVVGDGLPDDAAAHGEHLDVNFCALFNGVDQTKGDVKVRAGGKQTVLCPDGSLISSVLYPAWCGAHRAGGKPCGTQHRGQHGDHRIGSPRNACLMCTEHSCRS